MLVLVEYFLLFFLTGLSKYCEGWIWYRLFHWKRWPGDREMKMNNSLYLNVDFRLQKQQQSRFRLTLTLFWISRMRAGSRWARKFSTYEWEWRRLILVVKPDRRGVSTQNLTKIPCTGIVERCKRSSHNILEWPEEGSNKINQSELLISTNLRSEIFQAGQDWTL